MNHFDEMTMLLYLEGQLDAERAREVSTHAATCAECRELLHALQTEETWLRESLRAEDESVPAHLIAAPERSGAPWGWLTAFGFALGGAYTVWSGFIEPWRAQAAQAGFEQGNVLTMIFFSSAFWKGWDAMRSLTEFLAVATLGMAAMWLVRRHWRHTAAIAFVMAAMACALALPPVAMAAETHHGDPGYTLAAGEEVKTDLIVAADDTRIDGDVDGDLIVFSETVEVNGHIKGDILGFARELRVNGPVDGNVRTFCQSLAITGTIGRNLMDWSDRVELSEKGRVGGTMTVGADFFRLNGKGTGDLLAFVKELEINGALGHDALIRGDRIKIGPHAEIAGNTKVVSDRTVETASGAKLGSPVEFSRPAHGPRYNSARYYWHQALGWGASFFFGFVLLLIAPAFFDKVRGACQRALPAMGFGALALIVTPIAAILVSITIVGLGVGISTVLLYLIAIYSAQVFVGSWLGEKILGSGAGLGAALGRLAIGLAIVRAIEIVPVAGKIWIPIVWMWGLGALLMTAYRHIRPAPAAATA